MIVWVTDGLRSPAVEPPLHPFACAAARAAFTHSKHWEPTDAWIRQSGHAGRPQRVHARPVSRSGWWKQVVVSLAMAFGRSGAQTRRRRRSGGERRRRRAAGGSSRRPRPRRCRTRSPGCRSISLTSGISSARSATRRSSVLERGDVDRRRAAVAEQQRRTAQRRGPARGRRRRSSARFAAYGPRAARR